MLMLQACSQHINRHDHAALSKRVGLGTWSVSSPLPGDDAKDTMVNYLARIGFVGPAVNPTDSSTGDAYQMYISDPDEATVGSGDYPNVFEFTNNYAKPAVIVIWEAAGDTIQGTFLTNTWMQLTVPEIAYCIQPGKNITVVMKNGVTKAWAPVYMDSNPPFNGEPGLIAALRGEVNTAASGDPGATFDVSRETWPTATIPMTITAGEGNDVACKSQWVSEDDNQNSCYYKCDNEAAGPCGNAINPGYTLIGGAASQNANCYNQNTGHGGCKGWNNGSKKIFVSLGA